MMQDMSTTTCTRCEDPAPVNAAGHCSLCAGHHSVVTREATGSKLTPVLYSARCDDCGWEHIGSVGDERMAKRWAGEHRAATV